MAKKKTADENIETSNEAVNSEKNENSNVKEETKAETKQDERDEKIKNLEEELSKVKDQQLRLLAEYDNFRKRTEKEKISIYSDATAAVILEVLPVADNIERALTAKDSDYEALKKGIEMVMTQLLSTLKKLGVEEMAGEGEEFNPDLHNAVSHIDDDKIGENTVSAVFQKGYMLGDKVIRHAMVQVAN